MYLTLLTSSGPFIEVWTREKTVFFLHSQLTLKKKAWHVSSRYWLCHSSEEVRQFFWVMRLAARLNELVAFSELVNKKSKQKVTYCILLNTFLHIMKVSCQTFWVVDTPCQTWQTVSSVDIGNWKVNKNLLTAHIKNSLRYNQWAMLEFLEWWKFPVRLKELIALGLFWWTTQRIDSSHLSSE